MTTVRQIQRLWGSKAFDRLFSTLIANRVEGSLRLQTQFSMPAAASAIAIVRLDELGQNAVPLYSLLVRHLIHLQLSDGSWGDPLTTALATRALCLCSGTGLAINRAVAFLANLQRDDGLWPADSLRRLPSDALTSAFILAQIAEFPAFQDAVRFDQAASHFSQNEPKLDPPTQRLWRTAALRCRYQIRKNEPKLLFPPTTAAA